MDRWVVVAEATDVFGPFSSKEEAATWLKNKHIDAWVESYEEWQCSDHDLRLEDHVIVLMQVVG